jgi:hypothetical protein
MRIAVIFRIAISASTGFLVAVGWGFYFTITDKAKPIEPLVYTLANLTQPAAAVILYFNPHGPLGLHTVVLENAATYAMVGLIVETIRRRYLPLPNSR